MGGTKSEARPRQEKTKRCLRVAGRLRAGPEEQAAKDTLLRLPTVSCVATQPSHGLAATF